MLFRWWKSRRRRQILARPFPTDWDEWLHASCRVFHRLSPGEQTRLKADVQLLIAEKHWEGCNGLVVTPEMQVTIAASAALMSLGFPELPFDRLMSILIYPDTFLANARRQQPWGLEENVAEPRLGEAWYRGPVVLAWNEIRRQAESVTSPRNLVIHEFSHLLDMANADVDGIPPLGEGVDSRQWETAFDSEYRRLQRQLRFGRDTILDEYAATSRVEFFAVGSEAFFEQPLELRHTQAELYQLFAAAYRQDPACWWERENRP